MRYTRFEKARIIGARALQISMGSPILVDVPSGVVDLNVAPRGIEIRAETDRSREEEDTEYYFRERSYQALRRSLSFPEEVKADLAAATMKDGVLEVRIPKKELTKVSKPVKVR